MANRIIVPAHFDFEIVIRLDTNNGESDLQLRNRSKKQISMLQVVGMLAEHTAHIMKVLLTTGKVMETVVEEKSTEPVKSNGGDNNAS